MIRKISSYSLSSCLIIKIYRDMDRMTNEWTKHKEEKSQDVDWQHVEIHQGIPKLGFFFIFHG
jgi:hypothetical protein